MKPITSLLIKVKEKLPDSCRFEYMSNGWDFNCGTEKYLVKRATETGKVVLTYDQVVQARGNNVKILVVDNEGEILTRIPVHKFIRMFYGLEENNVLLNINGEYRQLKPVIVPGKKAVLISVFVSKEEYYGWIQESLKYKVDILQYLNSKLRGEC